MKKNNYESQTEKQLLSRCRRGDMNAFEEIIFRNKKYIYSWILSKEKNQHRAEDIFQRTLIKSWKAIKKFKGDSSYSTWANAIARNLVIDDYKRKLRNKEDHLEDIPESKRPPAEIDITPSPLEKITREEKSSTIKNILSKLPSSHEKILRLYYMDDLTYKEIADTMNCSMGTVMSRLFYAKKNMKKIMAVKNLKKIHHE